MGIPHLDLTLLETFVKVAEAGSFSAAATLMGQTQSTVSKRIAMLEGVLGDRLFARTGRGVEVTQWGLEILPLAQATLSSANTLVQRATSRRNVPSGIVRVGMVPSLAVHVVAPIYEEMSASFPEVILDISEGVTAKLEAALLAGDLDFAVLNLYLRLNKYKDELLGTTETYLVGPRDAELSRHEEMPFRNLRGIPLVLQSPPSSLRQILDRSARYSGFAVDSCLVIDSIPTILDMVVRGRKYTLLTAHSFKPMLEAGLVSASRIVQPSLKRRIVVRRSTVRAPSVAASRAEAIVKRHVLKFLGEFEFP